MARKQPKAFWKGPTKDGLTQSLLQRWICCRERFRLKVVEGLSEEEGFRHGLEFGNLWHEAEEKFCGGKPWKPVIKKYCQTLLEQYPTATADVMKWYKVCLLQFPIYIDHWNKDPETRKRKHLMQEVSFSVPYKLPSGRKILLRGKWDAVYKTGTSIYLQENKTKGKIDEEGIGKTLPHNLQTMFYLIALRTFARKEKNKNLQPAKIKGVMYNVIRRPLSQNSKHNIRQKKSETETQYYKRLGVLIKDNPNYFFYRWTAQIRKADYIKFKKEVFHPLLETFLDWWESLQNVEHVIGEHYTSLNRDGEGKSGYINLATPFDPWASPLHWQTPYGVYNSLWDGYRGDFFDYLTTGNDSNLVKIKTLYPEL